MKKRILLTSFQIWLPHHTTNSSDDLLIEVAKLEDHPHDLLFLRQLPVEVAEASSRVIETINRLNPETIVLCGMAEKRSQLSVEKMATCGETVLHTQVDLEKLVAYTTKTEISDDCGKFVCEGLYYSVLDYLQQHQAAIKCVFIHVPVLTPQNLSGILADFLVIIQHLALS